MRESEKEPRKKVKTSRSKKRDEIGKIKVDKVESQGALARAESNKDDASFKAIGLIRV